MSMRYVIIGGGIAGTTAAEELRKLDPSSEITIVSEEQHPIYSRVLLPHYIKGKIPRERVFLKKENWYSEQNIDWMPGVLAVYLDTKNKFVTLSNGREIEYDKMLIATGGEPRTIFENSRNISYLRSLSDADNFLELLNSRENNCNGEVFGGGFIACEYINLFAHFSIPTRVSLRGDFFWSKILDREPAEFVNQYLGKNGITLRKNVSFKDSFIEEELKNKSSIFGIGIGIETDFSWLKESGVEISSGIRANEFLETNIPDVYTAGDVAEFYDVIVGRHLKMGNWMSAMSQGRVVAQNMFGNKIVFELVSSYATNILGLEVIFIGDVSKESADEVRIIGSIEEGGITQLFGRKGQLVGAVLLNRNSDRQIITDFIKNKGLLPDKNRELLPELVEGSKKRE
ncbi:NAD(P)/FAD-dependent oxidoreductase [Candidatus Uhrbacteria bacterium]|nr:NAD(P)/FAD-dependent oxidoreductase [Candidatus Uhrbacteria bacterium]